HWSRQLEQSYREAQPVAIRHDHPASQAAVAVSFVNRHEPWLVLAERTAKHQPCLEWYWRAAAPDWKPALSADQTLSLCVRKLAAEGGLILTLVLASRLRSIDRLTLLLRSLRVDDLAGFQSALSASDLLFAPLPAVQVTDVEAE